MKMNVTFQESHQSFSPGFGEVHNISDGGFERGYAAGYVEGEDAGLEKGYADGLVARQYETWTITLEDGNVIEKDVALL